MATRGACCPSLSAQDRVPNIRLFIPTRLTDQKTIRISDPCMTSTPGPQMTVWQLWPPPPPMAVASVTFHFSLPDGPVDYFQYQGSHSDLTPASVTLHALRVTGYPLLPLGEGGPVGLPGRATSTYNEGHRGTGAPHSLFCWHHQRVGSS